MMANISPSSHCRVKIYPHHRSLFFYLGILLGDSGYALRPYLLTPILNPQNAAERRYNYAHIRTRNTVERLFGVWKRRFPCLETGLRVKKETALVIIVAVSE